MKQTWNSETIDAMLMRIDKLETDINNLIAAGDSIVGCLPSEEDGYNAKLAWEIAKTDYRDNSDLLNNPQALDK